VKVAFQREFNAAVTIFGRDVLRFVREWKNSLAFSLFFPVAFLGILGGTIGQNLGAGLGYNYMQFVLLGMAAALIVQTTMMNLTSLVEERETGFTQEIFVSPVSRYSIIIGKIAGSSFQSVVQLFVLFLVGLVMGIPLSLTGVGLILLVTPVIILLGGSLGVLLCGVFGSNPRAVDQAVIMIIFPQMFLSGALIPIGSSTGVLGVLTHVMPLTYLVDLLRGVFYQGTTTYAKVVLYNPITDLAISSALAIVFFVAGTYLFMRSERNR
jgi:ABC-2 type transport system permease protein